MGGLAVALIVRESITNFHVVRMRAHIKMAITAPMTAATTTMSQPSLSVPSEIVGQKQIRDKEHDWLLSARLLCSANLFESILSNCDCSNQCSVIAIVDGLDFIS